jgi:uncharacterized protein YkwD
MTRIARVALLAAIVALSAATAPAAAPGGTGTGTCRDATLVPTSANAKRIRSATFCLLNQQRRSHKLPKLTQDAELRRAAQVYSDQMVTRHFFDHTSPDGSTLSSRVDDTAYLRNATSWRLGETIAFDDGTRATPKRTVDKWMSTSVHSAQILNPHFRDIGIGATSGTPKPGGGSGATYTAVFGARAPKR